MGKCQRKGCCISKYRLEFEIEDLPKTYNELGRKHWIVKLKESRKWINLVRIAVGNRYPKEPLRKASLVLIRCSTRTPDPDGLVSSFKSTIDGLRLSGVLFNDSFEEIGMPEYKWEKAPKGKGKIKVVVTSIEDGRVIR